MEIKPDTSLNAISDCELTINGDFVDRLVKAFAYPLVLDLSGEAVAPIDIEHLAHNTLAGEPATPSEGTLNTLHDEHAIISEVIPPAMKDAYASIDDKSRESSVEHQHKIKIKTLKLSVIEAPKVILGCPIAITDINLLVDVSLDIGLRLLGKWRRTSANFIGVQVQGQQATLQYSTDGSNVYVLPQLKDLHVVTKFKVMKWQFNYRLNLTKTINKRLQSDGPVKIFSLDNFIQKPTHYGDITLPELRIKSINITDLQQSLKIYCCFDISPAGDTQSHP